MTFVVKSFRSKKITPKKMILICKSIKFGSQHDEDAFFEWIKKIKCIKNISAAGKELYLHTNNSLKDENLRDLLALFDRYKINMKQLQVFLNENNKAWFYENKKAYWHKRVFGSNKGGKRLITNQ